jgi:hypothetical protein
VIRNIHPSTPLTEIGIAINEIGPFTVRNVSNVLNKTTKNKLPIFFIDLESAEINKEIFHITSLINTKIKIEEQYKRRIIIQCTNCQEYGHSKSYWPTLQDASNVLKIILLPPAPVQNPKTNHQPAPSVEETTQLTTEAAKSTKTSKVSNTVKIFQIKNII